MKKSSLAFIIVTIILGLFQNIAYALPEIDSKIIYIGNASDLYKLGKACSFDAYSQGLEVILTADIDLAEKDFLPIPIFVGTFDGRGHTIKGLSIGVEGSNQGLFRYLEEGGKVKNLKVEGTITPAGEKFNIGGIVGYNKGIIENCEFSGYINGADTIGGLAGWNGNTGTIIGSSTEGIIYGKRKVGGIAGYNTGTIIRCNNNLSVNTTLEEDSLDLQDLDFDNLDISKLSKLSPNITDIGGVVGVNTGIIKNSQNNGSIGYPQVGYNVGGIAGRQTGYIANCINYGLIQGRKEVSGIVGQMEPNIDIIIPPSKLHRLYKELNNLQSLMNGMIEHTKYASSEMSQKLSQIKEDIDAGKAHANKLMNMTVDLIDRANVTGAEILDNIKPIVDGIDIMSKDIKTAISFIEETLKQLEGLIEDLLESGWDSDKLSSDLQELIMRLRDAQVKIDKARENVDKAFALLLSGEIEGVLELLRSASSNIGSAMEDIFGGVDSIDEIRNIIEEIISAEGGSIEDNLRDVLDSALEHLAFYRDIFDSIEGIYSDIENLLDFFKEISALDFETIGDDYQRTREDLFDSMGDISKTLSDFMDIISVQGALMIDDMQKMSKQMFLVMDLTFELIGDLMDSELNVDNIYKDVSREEIDKKTEGKVAYCKNFGDVKGDINIGGIAGAMAIEFKVDPEDDLDLMKGASLNAIFQTNAILQECENSGDIIAKKNHVGGIVGSMDLGYIIDCISYSLVESIDGNYVGGIAGRSQGPIVSSHTKSLIGGGNYVGGISGYAKEIIDSSTLVKVKAAKSCVGAIAGDVDTNANIENNYFVSDTLSGIDGISYAKKAEPIGYNDFISKGDLPSVFQEFELKFIADDEVISTKILNYGDYFSTVTLPDIPIKEGHYGEWDEFEEPRIVFDTEIRAKYTPIVKVLESDEKRNNTLPIVLVEGEFTDDDMLVLSYEDGLKLPDLGGEELLEVLMVMIPNEGDDQFQLRYLPTEKAKKYSLYIMKDGDWIKKNSELEGEYLVFEGEGKDITFCISYKKSLFRGYITYVGILAFAITLILIIRRFSRSKDREAPPSSI
ncbi:MAG: hypothetical protein GX974_00910 [Clostridiales bacterium]|nr:hypothetical protein [Clostridiales bacterium]